jgi:hypothetical protein
MAVDLVIITKVDNNKFVKYHSNNLDSFFKFLLKKFPEARFSNIYDKKTRKQIGTWTNKKGLIMTN